MNQRPGARPVQGEGVQDCPKAVPEKQSGLLFTDPDRHEVTGRSTPTQQGAGLVVSHAQVIRQERAWTLLTCATRRCCAAVGD